MNHNDRLKELQLERRTLAATIPWPERTPFLLNPDPIQRKHIKVVGWSIVALFLIVTAPFKDMTSSWSKASENREMRPAMESAMKAGNRAAGTWLALHFRKDYPGLLEQEADAGEPTALWAEGRFLMQSSHPEKVLKIDPALTPAQVKAHGLELVRRAAAAGNQDALKYAIDHGGL
jgi:hypothetical protein